MASVAHGLAGTSRQGEGNDPGAAPPMPDHHCGQRNEVLHLGAWVATVFAVAGFLGTGKTTFSRELERATGGVRISIDEWTIGLRGDDSALDPVLFSRTRNLLIDLWPSIARAGADVILDFGFWRREDRDAARARATEVGAQFRLYWLQCSEETSRTRAFGRREAGSYLFDEASFDHLRTRFEPLADDEAFEVVNS
jgi:predicted kinase